MLGSDNKVFARSGAGVTISNLGLVIKQDGRHSNMCLTNIIAHDSCTAFAEFNIANDFGLASEGGGFVGALVCQPDLDLDKYHAYGRNQGAYFMDLYDGGLCGSGKAGSDAQEEGLFTRGDRIGVLIQVGEQGFVKFFRNGTEVGPGFKAGEPLRNFSDNVIGGVRGPITGPLVIAVQTRCPSQSFELLPHSTLSPAANADSGQNFGKRKM
jgi:hypothetical protein